MDAIKSKSCISLNCYGRAYIFSVRPDPTWQLKKHQVDDLKAIWDDLESMDVEMSPAVPVLGYRGCSMKFHDDHKFIAYSGVVLKWTGSKILECRRDDEKLFEKRLLRSAPKELLPDELTLDQ